MTELSKRELLERNKKALEYYYRNRSKVMTRPYYAINTPEKNTREYYMQKQNPQPRVPKIYEKKPKKTYIKPTPPQCMNQKIHICSTFGCKFRSSK